MSNIVDGEINRNMLLSPDQNRKGYTERRKQKQIHVHEGVNEKYSENKIAFQ